jgi:acetolactate synthase-1/2/3 large subunit
MSDGGPLSHHGYYQSGTGDYGSWDAVSALRGVTKRVMVSHDPAQAVQHTQLAIKHALVGEPGPVAVIYHGDALKGTVGPDSVPRIYPTTAYLPRRSQAVDAEVLQGAAGALRSAIRPVIIAGNGVRVGQAGDALFALARALDAPVATTAAGKGVFPEVDPLGAGVMGTFGTPEANVVVGSADVILAVGTKLAPIDTADESTALLDPTRQTFIQIDVEPRNASWTFPSEHVLIGDAGATLDQLREAVGADTARADRGKGRVEAIRKANGYFDTPEYASAKAPIMPQRVIGELRRNLPDDSIVTCDAGENRILMTHFYQTRAAGGFLQAAGAGPMGFAIPAALAAKLVHPGRTVAAICGDGGFAMTMNGLMSALEHKIPIIVVVFNNHALGWVLHGGGPFAAEFNDFDHAAIARAMGCNGVRVTDPADIAGAIQTATRSDLPTVIDVVTSLDVSFRDVTSPLAS